MTRRREFLLHTVGGLANVRLLSSTTIDLSVLASDEPWLEALSARTHRAFLDVMHFFPDGSPFRRAATLVRVMNERYGARVTDIGIALGMHSAGLAHVVTRETWNDLALTGWLISQLSSAEAAALTANAASIADANGKSIREMRSHGIRVLACRETIGRWARRAAAERGRSVEEMTALITKGLHDGVEPVPAMVAAALLAQEHGAKYIASA
jgi:intracellular sulfur oxidation DsrE/DsrF family protein